MNFDKTEKQLEFETIKAKWMEINNYIMNELSKITEVYDVVPVWGDESPNEQRAIYGGHPNEEGCLKLARDFLEKFTL